MDGLAGAVRAGIDPSVGVYVVVVETAAMAQSRRLESVACDGFREDQWLASELEAQYERGEIERQAYFERKRGLVRLFLKAITRQRRIDGN